uniref:Uncharacterized protein n=1 Tax=Anguilla anguilla TaxID=7936 RepID=A0A0E9QNY1_ANGAN
MLRCPCWVLCHLFGKLACFGEVHVAVRILI